MMRFFIGLALLLTIGGGGNVSAQKQKKSAGMEEISMPALTIANPNFAAVLDEVVDAEKQERRYSPEQKFLIMVMQSPFYDYIAYTVTLIDKGLDTPQMLKGAFNHRSHTFLVIGNSDFDTSVLAPTGGEEKFFLPKGKMVAEDMKKQPLWVYTYENGRFTLMMYNDGGKGQKR